MSAYRAAPRPLRATPRTYAAMLMLFTVDGHTAVVDPSAVVGVWHANGRDWVALAAGTTLQVADEHQAIEQWLNVTRRGVTLPLDPPCGEGK